MSSNEQKEEEGAPHVTNTVSSTITQSQFLNMSTALLQSKLQSLQSESQSLASSLTAKLASSPSGQSLLHLGPSLSTLPPDLHSLLSTLDPLQASVAEHQRMQQVELVRIVTCGKVIEREVRRGHQAVSCRKLLENLDAAERILMSNNSDEKEEQNDSSLGEDDIALLDHASSLERVAHITLSLVQQVTLSSEAVTVSLQPGTNNNNNSTTSDKAAVSLLPSMDTPLPPDTEMAQFVLKLAPRIRTLEQNLTRLLLQKWNQVLSSRMDIYSRDKTTLDPPTASQLLYIGHLVRSMALMGLSSQTQDLFAQVAIMPCVKRHLSIGQLDSGGARGECFGLEKLLEHLLEDLSLVWADVLSWVEDTMTLKDPRCRSDDCGVIPPKREVDLITAGCWVPIATAFMTDPTIKMAIFSPGIASTLQANYSTLDIFLSQLACNLLSSTTTSRSNTNNTTDSSIELETNLKLKEEESILASYYYSPSITNETIQDAQDRLYAHPMTREFGKKWNLPIYYQLRFGEVCTRVDAALDRVQTEGWHADVFTGSIEDAIRIKERFGFELPIFIELQHLLEWLWSPRVFLKPLTHRFLRGAMQILGRVMEFVKNGLNGSIRFGTMVEQIVAENDLPPQDSRDVADSSGSSSPGENGHSIMVGRVALPPQDNTYCWGENITDVATVAWELTLLESFVANDYIAIISNIITSSKDAPKMDELKSICTEVLMEGSGDITPIISSIWNEVIVNVLITKCSGPLSAVKGVAATYRMTNRPPPTQASPFVATILRPVHDFVSEFSTRTPVQVGEGWKKKIARTIAGQYELAVSELIETVQRTEEALKNRKVRRAAAGGMSDGEKVKLQLYLDQQRFSKSVSEIGIDPSEIDGVNNLVALTEEAESLYKSQAY